MIFGKKIFSLFSVNKDADNTAELKVKVKELEAKNEILRTALKFYADTKSWEDAHKYTDDDDATILIDNSETGATIDRGSRAHRALKACES